MAVVSISRIQVRRGRKNEGSGLPQLASGEFGWAVDTQELFIGNGSVAEGAPYVGNTKVLTENDNILEFASLYEYKEGSGIITGLDGTSPIRRSIQERLDEQVTVKSFGADGDGTNQTAQIQQAISQLFDTQIFNPSIRMVLHFNAGEYVITDTIELPPNCVITGAGKNRTIITKATAGPAFKTVTGSNGDSPNNISVSDMTLNITGGAGFLLDSCTNSEFSNVEIIGSWAEGDPRDDNIYGFKLDSISEVITDLVIDSVDFLNLGVALVSEYDVVQNKITNCDFRNNYHSLIFGFTFNTDNIGTTGTNKELGFTNNYIGGNYFDQITKKAVNISRGNDNLFIDNRFNDIHLVVDPYTSTKVMPDGPVMKFSTNTVGNVSKGSWFKYFEQSMNIEGNEPGPRPYVPEIMGPVFYDNDFVKRVTLGKESSAVELIKLPADAPLCIEIDYFFNIYNSNVTQATRKGTITITADSRSNRKELVDDFSITSNNTIPLEFSLKFLDEDNDGQIESLSLFVENNFGSAEQADLSFRISTFR